jgi:predicted permease
VRDGLVVGQIGLALVLLAAAGLMLRSFANLRNVKPGLDPSGVLTFEVALPSADYPTYASSVAFSRQFQSRLAALPGVTGVGATASVPLQDFNAGCTGVGREGRPYAADEKPPCVATPVVSPGYFETLGVQVRGWTPTWSDVDQTGNVATVAVVTKALANRLWPNEDPIGKGIAIGGIRRGFYHVIGVIPELRAQGLDQPPTEAVFSAGPADVFMVKTGSANPTDMLPSIRRVLNEINPRAPIVNPRTMSDIVARSMARSSFIMSLLGIAGAMALFLSAVGIYGVISYLVTQRRAEIGVRMALGARVPQVAALVLGQSMRLTGIGVAIGLIAAIAGTRVLRSLLFDVSPTDPLVLGGTAIVLLLIAAFASVAPARTAANTDPVEAMRTS